MSLRFEQVSLDLGHGQAMVFWKLSRADGPPGPPVILAPAFGRAMDQMASMAVYLASHGLSVYRYDSLDHIGLSSGRMENFTLSTGLRSMSAALEWVADRHPGEAVGLVATSLSARVAYRLAAQSCRLAYLMTVVGVVHLQATLRQVFGKDYFGADVGALPEFVEFERQKVVTRAFHQDAIDGDWLGPESTAAELARLRGPLIAFVGEHDAWVDSAEVHRLIQPARHPGLRRLVALEGSAHELGKNPRNAERFICRATEMLCQLAITDWDGVVAPPSFDIVVDHTLRERRLQRAARSSPTGQPAHAE